MFRCLECLDLSNGFWRLFVSRGFCDFGKRFFLFVLTDLKLNKSQLRFVWLLNLRFGIQSLFRLLRLQLFQRFCLFCLFTFKLWLYRLLLDLDYLRIQLCISNLLWYASSLEIRIGDNDFLFLFDFLINLWNLSVFLSWCFNYGYLLENCLINRKILRLWRRICFYLISTLTLFRNGLSSLLSLNLSFFNRMMCFLLLFDHLLNIRHYQWGLFLFRCCGFSRLFCCLGRFLQRFLKSRCWLADGWNWQL